MKKINEILDIMLYGSLYIMYIMVKLIIVCIVLFIIICILIGIFG